MMNWERNWRGAGIVGVLFLLVASVVYGRTPKVGATAHDLVSFYDGDRTRILIATVLFSIGFLNLAWFAAALSTDLRDVGMGGWASAVTASSAAVVAILFLRMVLRAGLAFSIAGSSSTGVASALNDLAWAVSVIISFTAAMLVMAGSFGLFRAQMISTRAFGVAVAAVVLVLLGGTTWARNGFWAPNGVIAVAAQLVFYVWIVAASVFLFRHSHSTVTAPRRAVPTAA